MSLFNIDMPAIINQAMGSLLLTATLIKPTRSARTSNDLTSGFVKTDTSYATKGFYDDYREGVVDGTLVKDGDRKALLLAEPLGGVRPEVGDKITIEGETRLVVRVNRDPAAATYTCQVR